MPALQTIIYQMVLAMLRESKFSSANITKINKFLGLQGGLPTNIGTDEEFAQAIQEIVRKELTDIGLDESTTDQAQDLLDAKEKPKKKTNTETKATQSTQKVLATAQNPATAIWDLVQFIPHSKLIILAAFLAPLIFMELTRPGGLLDLRFKRIVDDEITAFLSRQSQKDTEMGFRQVVIQSKVGFTASNGVNNYNTIRGIREGGIDKERLDRIGMVDHSKGIFDFD